MMHGEASPQQLFLDIVSEYWREDRRNGKRLGLARATANVTTSTDEVRSHQLGSTSREDIINQSLILYPLPLPDSLDPISPIFSPSPLRRSIYSSCRIISALGHRPLQR